MAVTIKMKWTEQKNRARRRGIDWYFSFEQWLEWWGDDIKNRGDSKGQLCMARKGDTGPYHPDNVYKATNKQNIIEASQTNSKIIFSPKGKFASRNECASIYKVTPQCVSQWVKSKPTEFYYMENE